MPTKSGCAVAVDAEIRGLQRFRFKASAPRVIASHCLTRLGQLGPIASISFAVASYSWSNGLRRYLSYRLFNMLNVITVSLYDKPRREISAVVSVPAMIEWRSSNVGLKAQSRRSGHTAQI
jgi:hypothetical protein